MSEGDRPREIAPRPTREQFNLVQDVRGFMAVPPRNIDAFEAYLADVIKRVKTPMALTNKTMEGFIDAKELQSFTKKEELRDLLKALRIPFTDIPAFDGSYTLAVAESHLGTIQYAEIPGELHELKDDEGKPVFPGGLTRYAWAKMVIASALETLGSTGSMEDVKDAEYILSVATSEASVHMGSASYSDVDGNRFDAGVSGAELSRDAVEYVKRILLHPKSQDGDFTLAGIIDGLVAHWACRMMAEETVPVEQAQGEFERLLEKMRTMDRTQKTVPSHHH